MGCFFFFFSSCLMDIDVGLTCKGFCRNYQINSISSLSAVNRMTPDNLCMVFAPVLLRSAGEPSFSTLGAQKRVLLALLQVPQGAWLTLEHEMAQRAQAELAAAEAARGAATATPPDGRRGKSPFRSPFRGLFGKKRAE
jgi:hypothetical protein